MYKRASNPWSHLPRFEFTFLQSSFKMTTGTSSRLRYVSFALPLLVIAMVFGLGASGVHAVPHSEGSGLFSRDTNNIGVKAPPSSSFFLNGLKGQRPQTRHYNFVISQMNGAPDGFTKPMLVVNGRLTALLYRILANSS